MAKALLDKETAALTLGNLLERNANRFPHKTAIVFHDRTLSYRQLNETVNRLANSMLRRGLNKGDRIGLMLPRIPELVISFLAVAKTGAIAIPLNFELPAEGVQAVLDRTTPRFLIVGEQFAGLAAKSSRASHQTSMITTGQPADGRLSWREMDETGDSDNTDIDVQPGDVVYLNYTSGSTGDSKGAVTTHAHIYWNTVASVEALGLTPDDVHLCMFAPFAHPHELFSRPLYLGGAMVLLENVYPKSLAKAIEDNRVTCMMGLAPMYENLLEVLEHKTYDLSSLRIPESGGMFTRADLAERFRKKVGVPIVSVWGSTETTGIALANDPAHVVLCSMGRSCLFYEMRVVDDDGIELPPGEIGELIIKGRAVVESYYDDPSSSAASFRDGWYFTGDLVRRDEEGNVFFIERKHGMMKVAGLKVFPLEIEQVLLDHPGIKEAAIIAAKDRLRGEVPKAIIVCRDAPGLLEKDILAFCRERLSHYKVPRVVEFRDALPKIGSGKINKKALQKEEA